MPIALVFICKTLSLCVMYSVWWFGPPKVRFAAAFGVLIVAMCLAFGVRMMIPWFAAIQRLPCLSVRRPSGPAALLGSFEKILLFESELSLLIV